jgi:hypothetical protein
MFCHEGDFTALHANALSVLGFIAIYRSFFAEVLSGGERF